MLFVIAALCAYFVKGLCGFANTLIFGSILSFGANNASISPIDLVLGFPSNLIVAWQNRRDLRWRTWVPLAALVLLGSLPGIFLLKNGDAKVVKILFGAVVMGIGIEMLCGEYARKRPRAKGSRAVLALVGLASGALCGLYGVGALLAAYMSRVTDSNQAFRANLCAVFITENLFRIVVYSLTGILTLPVLRQALLLLPAMLIGLWAGMKSAGVLKESVVKKLVDVALILSGASLIVTNLL